MKRRAEKLMLDATNLPIDPKCLLVIINNYVTNISINFAIKWTIIQLI